VCPPSALDYTDVSESVLVVDDDLEMLQLVRLALERAGFDVWTAESAYSALELIAQRGLPHVAVVDIMMPGMDGLAFGRSVQEFSDMPIIILTAVADEVTRVHCLEMLADDYITKPFSPAELVARVRRLIRRVDDHGHQPRAVMRVDDHLSLALSQRQVIVDGKAIVLSPIENKILDILVRNAGRTVGVNYLLRRVWPSEDVLEDTLRVHIHRLRQKIEPNPDRPSYVLTERGHGYRFVLVQ